MNKFDLSERLIDFASNCLDLADHLPNTLPGSLISQQFIKSCTSPALHYGEAQAAESRPDFIHKMKICLKELRETYNCLLLILMRKWSTEEKIKGLLKENDELISIFVSSCKTALRNHITNNTSEGTPF